MAKVSFPIKQIVKTHIRNRIFGHMSKALASEEDDYAIKHMAPDLSIIELDEIKTLWKGICPNLSVGYNGFRDYKLYFGFDKEYVPFSYFFPWMARVLSPIDAARVFANKGLTYTYFKDVAQPKLIARKVNGCVFDALNKAIDNSRVVELLSNIEKRVVVKDSLGSCCGKGVRLIEPRTDLNTIRSILTEYTGDYVIQEVLTQFHETARFNQSSLNTFRLSTLLLNGRFSVCTAMLRFGTPGNIVDNVGAGGACVGINDDGSLMPFGFNKAGEKLEEWNGLKFKGLKISLFNKIVEAARKAHYDIPLCAFVGWDLALDSNGEVNLIEANIEWPGLFFEQLANARPAFRDRFEEVLQYVREHPLPLLPMYNATN